MPSVQRRRSAGRVERWSVVVLRAGERLGASWSADVSACAVCICGHKSSQVTASTSMCYTCTCSQTKDPPEIQPDRGARTGVRDTIQGSTDHATRDEIARSAENRRGKYRRHACARHHDARVARPQPRRGRSAASNASPSDETSDETTFTCFTNGNISRFVHVHAGSTHIPCGRPQRDLAEISPVACTARPQ